MGIFDVMFDEVETPLNSTRNKAFYDALLEAGLQLEEQNFERPEPYGIDYDSLSDEEKRSLYPSLIEELRVTPDWGQQTYPYSLRPRAGKLTNKPRYQVKANRISLFYLTTIIMDNCLYCVCSV